MKKFNWNYPTSICVGENRIKDLSLACKNLNRKFIGIESDKDYFNIAEKRINDTVS